MVRIQQLGTMPNGDPEGYGRLMMLNGLEDDQELSALGSINPFVIFGVGLILLRREAHLRLA